MSLEKEFAKYSNLLKNNRSITNSANEELEPSITSQSVLVGGSGCTYLNVKLVLTNDLLEEINAVSNTLGVTPEVTLANYLQYGNDIQLVPIRPEVPLEEDLDYDVTYLIDVNDQYFEED